MTDANEIPELTSEELITRLLELAYKNQEILIEMNVGLQKFLTRLSTPRFDNPSLDEKKHDLTPNMTGKLKQIVKDRENLARKTVLIEKLQDLLDAHYGWENENGIDD